MSKFTDIQLATTTTLITKANFLTNNSTNVKGSNKINVSRISITNWGVGSTNIKLFLDDLDGSDDYYIIGGIDIPQGVTYIYDEGFPVDLTNYDLKLTN